MRRTLWLLSSLVVFACGSKTDSGGGAGALTGVAAEDFVARWVEATCGPTGTCCTNAGIAFDGDHCVVAQTREGRAILNDTNAKRTYDPAGAATCIDGVRSIVARCSYASTLGDEVDEVCHGLFRGTVATGGACQSSKDCALSDQGPVDCQVDRTAPAIPPMPVCVVDPPGLAGEPCVGRAAPDLTVAFPHRVCADGLYCDATSHCQATVGEGAACTSDECGANRSCENGVCTPLADLGAPCIDDLQCKSRTCYQQACATGVPIGSNMCSSIP